MTITTARPSPVRRAAIVLATVASALAAPAAAHPHAQPGAGVQIGYHDAQPIQIAERRKGAKKANKRRASRGAERRIDPRAYHHGQGYGPRAFCRPRRAIRKAWRMGVDAPRIHRVGRRAVVVSGYRGRHYVRVRFAHARRCPVLAVRRF